MILKEYLDKNYTKEEQINLTLLSCSHGGITSFEGIEVLVKLEWLHCSYNKLTTLKGIEGLVKLQKLNCSYNKLISLKEIENLDNLKWLYCYNNPLPYSDLFNYSKIKLEIKKEIRQYKIQNLLL